MRYRDRLINDIDRMIDSIFYLEIKRNKNKIDYFKYVIHNDLSIKNLKILRTVLLEPYDYMSKYKMIYSDEECPFVLMHSLKDYTEHNMKLGVKIKFPNMVITSKYVNISLLNREINTENSYNPMIIEDSSVLNKDTKTINILKHGILDGYIQKSVELLSLIEKHYVALIDTNLDKLPEIERINEIIQLHASMLHIEDKIDLDRINKLYKNMNQHTQDSYKNFYYNITESSFNKEVYRSISNEVFNILYEIRKCINIFDNYIK